MDEVQKNLPVSFINDSSLKKTDSSSTATPSSESVPSFLGFEEGNSPWTSLWLCNVIMLFAGIQFSVYFTSMWPFLQSLDKSINLGFFGFVIASYSVGQAIASPLFGYWTQKTKGARRPVMTGMALTIAGNLVYALLPTINVERKWAMLFSRFLVGFGSGVVGVLRAYIAAASTDRDRSKAVALGIAGYVVGVALGPATQTCFQPIGEVGWSWGTIHFNMYTLPSYVIIAGAFFVILLLQFVFVESYAGVISDLQKKANPYMVLSKFDKVSAVICIYLWFIQQCIGTTNELISAPFTMAMYDWSDQEAVLYNGIIQFISTLVSLSIYFLHAFTRIGRFDSRKLIIFGLVSFFLYHIATLPWPFFDGPLHFRNMSADPKIGGGCDSNYSWCAYTTRVPLSIYIFSYIVLIGLGFPNLGSPLGTLFSKILGPRHQGNMQGAFTFVGSLARCISPLFVTNMFEHFGPVWPWAAEAVLIGSGVALVLVSYRRLVPLKTMQQMCSGDKIKYKMGTVYHL